MAPDNLDEREFELVNIIGYELEANQRQLSRQLNLSLGATNILIRRLITKGYIRVSQLNKKKVRYLLTPQGFAQKVQKSVKYTLNTIRHIGMLQGSLTNILQGFYKEGVRHFYICGESGLVPLVELEFAQNMPKDCKYVKSMTLPSEEVEGKVLICQENLTFPAENPKYVYLIEELARTKTLIEKV